MNKRILVAGCSDFVREYTRNGLYFIRKDLYLMKLYLNYRVDNLSSKTLTAKKAAILIDAFTGVDSYSEVLIALGEGDALAHTDLKEFEDTIRFITDLLDHKNIAYSFVPSKNAEYAEYSGILMKIEEELKNSLKNKKSSEELSVMPKLA